MITVDGVEVHQPDARTMDEQSLVTYHDYLLEEAARWNAIAATSNNVGEILKAVAHRTEFVDEMISVAHIAFMLGYNSWAQFKDAVS